MAAKPRNNELKPCSAAMSYAVSSRSLLAPDRFMTFAKDLCGIHSVLHVPNDSGTSVSSAQAENSTSSCMEHRKA